MECVFEDDSSTKCNDYQPSSDTEYTETKTQDYNKEYTIDLRFIEPFVLPVSGNADFTFNYSFSEEPYIESYEWKGGWLQAIGCTVTIEQATIETSSKLVNKDTYQHSILVKYVVHTKYEKFGLDIIDDEVSASSFFQLSPQPNPYTCKCGTTSCDCSYFDE